MQIVFPDDWNGAFEAAPEIARLRERAEVKIHRVRPANLMETVRDADIAVALRERTRYDAVLLAGMPRLELIVSASRTGPSAPASGRARSDASCTASRLEFWVSAAWGNGIQRCVSPDGRSAATRATRTRA